MIIGSRPIFLIHRSQEAHPSIVQCLDEPQRVIDRCAPSVVEFCPPVLQIGFDPRHVFGECQAKAYVGIRMAVRNVMNDLAQRPSLRSIGSVELRIGKVLDGLSETLRKMSDLLNPLLTLGRSHGIRRPKAANGIPKNFVVFCHVRSDSIVRHGSSHRLALLLFNKLFLFILLFFGGEFVEVDILLLFRL